jgi:hypothetical protein
MQQMLNPRCHPSHEQWMAAADDRHITGELLACVAQKPDRGERHVHLDLLVARCGDFRLKAEATPFPFGIRGFRL